MLFNTITALALASSAAAVPTYGLEPRQAATLNAAMVARGRSCMYIWLHTSVTSD